MITEKVNRYICEFCNKKGLSASHISKHEKRCTKNPNRYCGLCEETRDIKTLINDFSSRFKIGFNAEFLEGINEPEFLAYFTKPLTLDDVIISCDGCPACTLAVLRQSKLLNIEHKDKFKFDFKEESLKYLSDKHPVSGWDLI